MHATAMKKDEMLNESHTYGTYTANDPSITSGYQTTCSDNLAHRPRASAGLVSWPSTETSILLGRQCWARYHFLAAETPWTRRTNVRQVALIFTLSPSGSVSLFRMHVRAALWKDFVEGCSLSSHMRRRTSSGILARSWYFWRRIRRRQPIATSWKRSRDAEMGRRALSLGMVCEFVT